MLCFAGQNVSRKMDGEAFPAGGFETRSFEPGSWSDRPRSGTDSSGIVLPTFLRVVLLFPRASERRVLLIVGVCDNIFTSVHLHILFFTSVNLHVHLHVHLHIFSSSHLFIFTSCSSHLLIFTFIFTSSHLHIICSSSHLVLHIFSSSRSSSHLLIFTSVHLHIC